MIKSNYLNVHLDDCLSNQRGSEESPERDEKVSAGDAGQVEQGIRNLEKGEKDFSHNLISWYYFEKVICFAYRRACQDAEESDPLHQPLHSQLGTVEQALKHFTQKWSLIH